jgi:Fe2+ or Zn2+ uptake regulation protein
MADERTAWIVERLRADGGRVTAPRRAVVQAMVESTDHHLTAAELLAAVRGDDPDFYESTVYRTLDRLVELGVVERVQLGATGAVFHLAQQPHHHLVCESCGSVTHAPATAVGGLAAKVRRDHGFELTRSLSLTGTCADCAAGG